MLYVLPKRARKIILKELLESSGKGYREQWTREPISDRSSVRAAFYLSAKATTNDKKITK